MLHSIRQTYPMFTPGISHIAVISEISPRGSDKEKYSMALPEGGVTPIFWPKNTCS